MEYSEIILEMLTRIKKLEDEVAILKQSAVTTPYDEPSPATKQKMTEEKIKLCYEYGKEAANNPSVTPWALALSLAKKHNINKSSAFMYICAIKSMLEGKEFKRTINSKAIRIYFDAILTDYGKEGLKKALHATELHIKYRKSFNHNVVSLEKLCDEFKQK